MNCPKCGTEFQVVFSGETSGKVKRASTDSRAARSGQGPDHQGQQAGPKTAKK
jgi:hypothetical protein